MKSQDQIERKFDRCELCTAPINAFTTRIFDRFKLDPNASQLRGEAFRIYAQAHVIENQ